MQPFSIMKQLILEVFNHPTLDYSAWFTTPAYHTPGVHTLKDGTSYIRLIGTSQLYLDVPSTQWVLSQAKEQEVAVAAPPTVIGISEDALLAALAIVQKPELAPQLLALRKS